MAGTRKAGGMQASSSFSLQTDMVASLSRQRLALAIVASVAGIVAGWVTATPFGLLAPIAALFLYARDRSARIVWAGLAIGLAASVMAIILSADDVRVSAVSWAAFFAVALCIGATVATAVSASALAHVNGLFSGSTGGDSASSGEPRAMSLIHPDDRPAAAHAAARAFWTNVPQVMRYRLRQPDGSYRWTETRTNPKHGASVDIHDLVGGRDEPTTVASDRAGSTEEEPVRAARIVENLFGNAWAFDAAGAWIYLPLFAQTTLGRTPEDLNASLRDGHVAWKQLLHPDEYDEVAANWRNCLNSGEPFSAEFRIRRKTGYAWARSAARPLRDSRGRISGWYGTSIDIDVFKKTLDALRDRERELSQLVDMVPSHLWRLRADGEPIFFNKRMVDYLGLDVADMNKPGMTRLAAMIGAGVHPDDAAAFRDGINRSLRTGENFALRYRLRRADGVYHWMSSRAEPLRDQDGRIVQWYGLCHDIDDHVKAEEAMRRSEQQLQRLVGALPVNILSWTPAGELTYVNKRYLDELGLSEPNFEELARAAHELVHPEDAPEVQRKAAQSIQSGAAFAMRYRRRGKNGAYRWLDGRFEPLRDPDGAILEWSGISVDIDDVVRAQEALRDRERELSQLVDIVPSLLWRLNPDGEPVFFSKRMIDYFGLDVGDYNQPGMSGLAAVITAVVHPDDAERLDKALRHSFATGESFALNYRLRRADGVYRWMSGRGEPLRDDSGHILQWYGLCHDIDDQVRAEGALRESEQALRQLVETLPAMIDCAAPDGEPIYRSRQLREFLGYNLEDLDETGKSRLVGTLDAGVHPDDLAAVKERYAYSLSTGEPYMRKHRLRRFDGEYRWVETRAAAMRNAEGAILQWNVICLDIDGEVRAQEELRLARERLARASQAASLAELSASIAHEVNQPLAAVVANSHAGKRWLEADPPNIERAQKAVERIVRDANAAADVVSRIRALFKQAVEAREIAALGSAIEQAHELMTQDALRRGIRFDIKVEENLPLVALDRVQIQQVLVNLIRNGMEAMDSVVSARVLDIRAHEVEGWVQVEIGDHGPGIAFPDRIFEPFFTTKGQGMGMGLAISRSIVESHGGRLWAENSEPHGATLLFTLPVETRNE